MGKEKRVSKSVIRRGRVSQDNIVMGNVVKGGRIRAGSNPVSSSVGAGRYSRVVGRGSVGYGGDVSGIGRLSGVAGGVVRSGGIGRVGSVVAASGIVRAAGMGGMAYSALGDLYRIYSAGREVGRAIRHKPVRAIERGRLGVAFLRIPKREMVRKPLMPEGMKVVVKSRIRTGVYTRAGRSGRSIERIGRSVGKSFSGGIVPRSRGIVRVVNRVNPYVPEIVGMPKIVEGIR